jgi:hypothetical protein
VYISRPPFLDHWTPSRTAGRYSATLTVAARTRPALLGPFPQLALGLVLDTPHKRIGANAITTLKPLATPGLPAAFAVVDRAYHRLGRCRHP